MEKVYIPKHITTTEFKGSSILLDLQQNTYYALNDSAATFWNFLIDLGSTEAAFAETLKLYDVSEKVLINDIIHLIESLIEAGLLQKK